MGLFVGVLVGPAVGLPVGRRVGPGDGLLVGRRVGNGTGGSVSTSGGSGEDGANVVFVELFVELFVEFAKVGTIVSIGTPALGPGVSCRSDVSIMVGTGVVGVPASGSRVGKGVFL